MSGALHVRVEGKKKTKRHLTYSHEYHNLLASHHVYVSPPEDEDQILLLCFFGLIGGVVQGIAAVVCGQHLHKVLVGVCNCGSQVTQQDLFAFIQHNVFQVLAQTEQDGLLPLSLLVLIGLSFAHFHVIEDGDHFICDFHTRGLKSG